MVIGELGAKGLGPVGVPEPEFLIGVAAAPGDFRAIQPVFVAGGRLSMALLERAMVSLISWTRPAVRPLRSREAWASFAPGTLLSQRLSGLRHARASA